MKLRYSRRQTEWCLRNSCLNDKYLNITLSAWFLTCRLITALYVIWLLHVCVCGYKRDREKEFGGLFRETHKANLEAHTYLNVFHLAINTIKPWLKWIRRIYLGPLAKFPKNALVNSVARDHPRAIPKYLLFLFNFLKRIWTLCWSVIIYRLAIGVAVECTMDFLIHTSNSIIFSLKQFQRRLLTSN